jgi:hypothetical protein
VQYYKPWRHSFCFHATFFWPITWFCCSSQAFLFVEDRCIFSLLYIFFLYFVDQIISQRLSLPDYHRQLVLEPIVIACQWGFMASIDSDGWSITASSWLELTVIGCVLSLLVEATNRQSQIHLIAES